jgi:hypothetical protein
LAASLLAGACSPGFDWREVRIESTGLKAMLPCKPDKGAREVPMAGRLVTLQALGCDAQGVTYAVLFADLGDATQSAEVLAQWNRATLANLRAPDGSSQPFVPKGAIALPSSAEVRALGRRADGSPLESRAAYFARGGQVFQALVFAGQLQPQSTDPFFQGLQFE